MDFLGNTSYLALYLDHKMGKAGKRWSDQLNVSDAVAILQVPPAGREAELTRRAPKVTSKQRGHLLKVIPLLFGEAAKGGGTGGVLSWAGGLGVRVDRPVDPREGPVMLWLGGRTLAQVIAFVEHAVAQRVPLQPRPLATSFSDWFSTQPGAPKDLKAVVLSRVG